MGVGFGGGDVPVGRFLADDFAALVETRTGELTETLHDAGPIEGILENRAAMLEEQATAWVSPEVVSQEAARIAEIIG